MSPTGHDRVAHTVPVSVASQLIDLAKNWHVRPEDLLGPVGLTEKVFEDPLARIPVPTMCELLRAARSSTGEPGLGFYLGMKTQVTLYGYLGFAALSAPS